jgi:DNA-directed RNA polymerase subunit H (RpoH/RPB5)
VQRLIVFSNELFPPNLKKICASLEAGGTRLTNRTFEFVKHLSNDHALVPLHVVMSDEERDLVLSQERTGLENFPILRMGDIQRELIDARPGQMVKIYRATENGYVLTYAVVTA